MNFEVDPSFKKGQNRARKRRARRRLQRIVLGLVAVVGLAGVGAGIWGLSRWMALPDVVADPATPPEDSGDESFAMVQMETSAESGVVAARAPFLDLRKDPMILHIPEGSDGPDNTHAGPDDLDAARVGPMTRDRLVVLRDDLLQREAQLVTTIPSSREDLAFFQAQRAAGIAALSETAPSTDVVPGETAGNLVEVDGDDGSWGELIDTGQGGDQDDRATYVETRIENTTSVVLAVRDQDRVTLYRDHVVALQTEREIEDVLTGTGISEDSAERIEAAMERLLGQPETLPAGVLVAMRLRPDPINGPQLMQMTLYNQDGYIGTLAQIGVGRFDTGADPWVNEDLMSQSRDIRAPAAVQNDVRLLDALYSAGIRNGLSTTMVGELIVIMSQKYDLDRFAAVGDQVTLIYANEPGPRGQGAGRILFAQIKGESGDLKCYVVFDESAGEYGCFDGQGSVAAGGMGGGGLVVPVTGTRTSGFGPRMHPILRQLRNHNGVDWAAPTGTPIRATAAGRVSVAGVGGGYGNVVYIDHAGGLQSRYAHLHGFADGIRAGTQVAQGEVIGYVGTTGRSTGPHLHFELRVNGQPVDPLTYAAVPAAAAQVSSGPAGAAVEALVNQIIQVESAGNANAANPRSTAVGLGQFIESTWIRMMQTYRPDLVQSMSRAELLALRRNPEMSREMVRNLARENEAFLRARGHQITPGRLYLAHFLGPGGANTALRANPNQTVLEVMGSGVVNANPFLRGQSIADLWAWADRKMNRTGSSTPTTYTPPVAVIPAETRAYMEAIDGFLEEIEG